MYLITPQDPRPNSGDQVCAHRVRYVVTIGDMTTDHEAAVNDFLEALRALENYTAVIKSIDTQVIKFLPNADIDVVTQVHYKLIGPPATPVLP